MHPRDELLQSIAGRRGQNRAKSTRRGLSKARELLADIEETKDLTVATKSYDEWPGVLQQMVQTITGELQTADPDLDAITEALAAALQAVMDASDQEEEDDSMIQDTAEGAMLRVGKGIVLDPFWGSSVQAKRQRDLIAQIKAAQKVDRFWGSRIDEE